MQANFSADEGTTPTGGHPYGDPHGWCRDVADPYLNHHGPPIRTRLPHGGDGWMVTRFHDVRTVLTDRRVSRALAAASDFPRMTPAPSSRAALVSRLDPPEHSRLRRLHNNAFSIPRVRTWQSWVWQYADGRIDRIIAAGPPADLVRDLFNPLGHDLIGEMMGIPEHDRSRLGSWATAQQSTVLSGAEVDQNVGVACAYFDDLVRQRRRCPGSDIITEALQIREREGGTVPDEDVASLSAGLFATAFEALSAQFQTGTHALLSDPDELAKLVAHPEIAPHAVEELIRYAPIQNGPARARGVVEDVEVSGVVLRAGEFVLPSVAAAGFDSAVIPDPYRLDLSRRSVPTITFGFGSHFCQGSQLARMAMSTVLPRLVQRLPNLRVAVPNDRLRWRKSKIRSWEELPVSWAP